MASVIVSNTGSLVLNDGSSTVPKGGYTVSTSNDKVYVKSGSVTWTLDFNDTTLDGADYGSAKELASALSDFSRGGSGPGPEPGDAVWGGITGTLSDQSDLQSALNSKADSSSLGTAAAADVGDFATAEQGTLAGTAVQPDDLADVATSGSYNDLKDQPNIPTVPSTIPQAEVEAGTATTQRTITAQRVRQGVIGASRGIVTVSGNKTLALTDEYTFQNVTAAATITVPANATVALPVGSQIDFFQAAGGVITFAAAGGVTIISKGSALATTEAGDAATLKKTGTDTWALIIAG